MYKIFYFIVMALCCMTLASSAQLSRHWSKNGWGTVRRPYRSGQVLKYFHSDSKRISRFRSPATVGRGGRLQRLKELRNDPKLGGYKKAWLNQEYKNLARKKKSTMRMPFTGTELAHPRGWEAAKGRSHAFSMLQDGDLHRLQHQHDRQGALQKMQPKYMDHLRREKAKLFP